MHANGQSGFLYSRVLVEQRVVSVLSDALTGLGVAVTMHAELWRQVL